MCFVSCSMIMRISLVTAFVLSSIFSGNAQTDHGTGLKPSGIEPLQKNGTTVQQPTWNLQVGKSTNCIINTLSVTATTPSEAIVPLQSSDLPIIKINTFGQNIPDNPKIPAQIQIIYNGPGVRNNINDTPYYDGLIGIETRGSWSQTLPKKSYGFDTRDATGIEVDTPLLGMPAESDWILNASYSDKTFMRNTLSYELSRSMGHYASRSQHCEITINGQYMGIFILMEKIKRDSGRVDIAKLNPEDTIGNAVTGGYILKVDKSTGSLTGGWPSQYAPYMGGPTPAILYEYPEGTSLHPLQVQYIQQYCDSFENALHGNAFMDPVNGYRRFIALDTWVDYFIINEISKNVDGYRISSFFHKAKDSDGGLLRMGPVWDYDIAWGNADYNGGNVVTGYQYLFNDPSAPNQPPFWWIRLMQDPYFRNAVRCRWDDLRTGILSTAYLHNWVDSMAVVLNESQGRNFVQWPILGIYVWPNPAPFPPDYPGVVQELKNWISNRTAWLDANLPGTCITAGMSDHDGELKPMVYPNPAGEIAWLMTNLTVGTEARIRIYNSTGQVKYNSSVMIDDNPVRLPLRDCGRGILLIEISSGNTVLRTKLIRP